MQHHFDGIIFPENDQDRFCEESAPTRRDALRQIAIGGAAAFALTDAEPAAAESKPPKIETPRAGRPPKYRYSRYVVIPKDFRRFRVQRRKELGVGGGYFRIVEPKTKKAKAGYLAWLTKAGAEKVKTARDVAEVRKIEAHDLSDPGPKPNTSQLAVQLVPNDWRLVPPPKGSYVDTDKLVDAWSKKFKMVKFKKSRTPSTVLINIGPAGLPEQLVKSLKLHPQVARISWNVRATTLALGEEGATTKALGEEGASTRRRGEEGGKVTTLRVGEEGGKVTTKALGEEGGKGSTRRLGEEGGKRPPKVSTRALGEEGGKRPPRVTTQALGEEGGRR